MSGPPGYAYPPGQGPPPHPSQSAYPPMGYPPPGQPGYGPPPGQPGYVPPPGQPGYYGPPPGQPGYGAPYGMPPPGAGYPGGPQGYPAHKSSGNDSDDSQPGDPGLRSSRKGKKMQCTFENRTGTKVGLFRIDEHGKPKLVEKMKDGKKEKADIEEGEVFFAVGKKRKKRRAMINNNTLFTVMADSDGDDKVRAVISNGPAEPRELSSETEEKVKVKVKFINRSKKHAQLVYVDHKKKWEKKKVLAPGKCFTTDSYEGKCWVAYDKDDEDEGLYMNYSFFYSPWKTRLSKERVIITDDRPWSDSSGSSDSD